VAKTGQKYGTLPEDLNTLVTIRKKSDSPQENVLAFLALIFSYLTFSFLFRNMTGAASFFPFSSMNITNCGSKIFPSCRTNFTLLSTVGSE
jgi:hypothetical protein